VRWSYNKLELNVFTKFVVLGSCTVWKIVFFDVLEERVAYIFHNHWRLMQHFPPKRRKFLNFCALRFKSLFSSKNRRRNVCVIIRRWRHTLMFSCLVYVFALSVRLFTCQTSYSTVTSIRKKMQVERVWGVFYKTRRLLLPLLILNYVCKAKCSAQPLKCEPLPVIHDQELLSGSGQ